MIYCTHNQLCAMFSVLSCYGGFALDFFSCIQIDFGLAVWNVEQRGINVCLKKNWTNHSTIVCPNFVVIF